MFNLKEGFCDFNNADFFLSEREVLEYIKKCELVAIQLEFANGCTNCLNARNFEQKEKNYFDVIEFSVAYNEITKEKLYSDDSYFLMHVFDGEDSDDWEVYEVLVGKCIDCDEWFIDYSNL